MHVLALDLAKARSGMAYYDGSKITTWNVGPSSPVLLYQGLAEFASTNPIDVVLIEEHVHFRSAKTTRVLIETNGYVYWSFVRDGYSVQKLFPFKSRKRMKDQYLTIPDDERDAALLIHEHLGSFEPLLVERKSNNEECNIGRKTSKKRAAKREAVLDGAS